MLSLSTTSIVLEIPLVLKCRWSWPSCFDVSKPPAPATATFVPPVAAAVSASFMLPASAVFFAAAVTASIGVEAVVVDDFLPPPHAAAPSGNASSRRTIATRRPRISTCAPRAATS